MNRFIRIALFAMAAVLLASAMVFAGPAGETAGTTTEVLTLNYMSNANVPGLAEGMWWTNKLEEDIGVKLTVISFSQETYNASLAAGKLADFTYLTATDPYAKDAIAAGQLINFDDYADLIPNVFKIYPEGSLRYQRDTIGGGAKLYTIPDGPTTDYYRQGHIEYGIRVAWDYYLEYVEKNGEPVLKELEDFLPVLKAIQDAHPTNEDGQKVYAFTYFTSWDASWNFSMANISNEMIGGWNRSLYPLLISTEDLSYYLFWEDGSPFKRMVEFFFEANQLGMFDPDAPVQTFDDYGAKFASHRALAYWAWGGNEDFYRLVPFDNMKTTTYNGPWYLGNVSGGGGVWVSNGRDEQYIERTCEFLNYMIDYDNAWYTAYGPKGTYWNLNSDGIPYITELGTELSKNAEMKIAEGGNPGTQSAMGILGYWRYFNPATVHPGYGVPFTTAGWALRDGYVKEPIQASWEDYMFEKYGVKSVGNLTNIELLDAAGTFAEYRICNPTQPDAIKDFNARLSSVYENWWNMVFAANRAEFDSLWISTQDTLAEMWKTTGWTKEKLANLYLDQLRANEKYF